LSWRHYVVGSAALVRATAQAGIENYRAVASGMSGGEARDRWLDEMQRIAGMG
jgi:hypothetical protein